MSTLTAGALQSESALSAPDTLPGRCMCFPKFFPWAYGSRAFRLLHCFSRDSFSGPPLPDMLQFGYWLGLSDRDNTPITGHHQAGREKTAEALIAVSSNGQAAGCPAESRTGWGGGEGRETEPWHV